MNGMEKITARMKEDAARSLSELNAQTEQEFRRIAQVYAPAPRIGERIHSSPHARKKSARRRAGARISPRRSAMSASAPRRRWRHAS